MSMELTEAERAETAEMESPQIRRALISVSDKMGMADFAKGLRQLDIEIYSTGGTRKLLDSEGVSVQDVAAYTGFPEMMDGRVKTLHPKIFAGILCRHDRPDDMSALEQHDILPIELVVVNLYPFEATVARPETTREQAVEQVDIGGPSLVRAAAKNHQFVTVATNPAQYASILQEIAQDGCTTLELRRQLMASAFLHTANYDCVISQYFQKPAADTKFPVNLNISLKKKCDLRYGENPHQAAALYGQTGVDTANLVAARQLNGKELSYNNLLDLDSALAIVRGLPDPSVSVIKHNNPCGAASAHSLLAATQNAMEGDPVSAFGSVLAFNRALDAASAEFLSTPGFFVEAIVAPDFDPAAVEILTSKPKWKNNVRLMQVGNLANDGLAQQLRYIEGGILIQDADCQQDPESVWQIATEAKPDERLLEELRFGWHLVRFVKSNAITLSKNRALCGVGAGQMSRVDSVEIAISKAGDRAQGCVLASDAFFPFPDSIHHAAAAGISAIIQPGGSKNDEQVVAACDEHGLPMIFTGRRHFKH